METSMTHELNKGDTIKIRVKAGDAYSPDQLKIAVGEAYRVWCDKGQWWVDLFIPSTPMGYYNPVANMFGQRVKGVKCLCLCGAYNNSDVGAFAIGTNHEFTIEQDTTLSFFANDVPGYEWNNLGSIVVNIERVK